jgi:transcriptional regulator with XRE-family HTH domain
MKMPIIPNTEFMLKRRKELNLSQKDVAKRVQILGLGLNDNHYSRIERGVGSYTNIKLETAFGIAEALRCNLQDIFTVEFPNQAPRVFPTTDEQKERKKNELKQGIKKEVGQKLKEIRLSRSIPATLASEDLGLHVNYVYLIERGLSSIERLKAYAEYLDIDFDEMTKI